ncbi:MAG: glycosyltransferase family A protein [Pseudomonadota bacterium]
MERAPVGTDGIRAKVLVPEGGAKSPLAEVARAPAAVYEWLKSQSRFDVVCTADAHGLAYYAQLARHLGLGFTNTRFAVVSVVPILWQVEQAQTLIGREIMLGRGFVEQRSLELADIQVVSCRDLRMWMARRGYQLQPEKLQEQIELPKEAPVPVREPSPVLPSVSVCLTHHNRPELIEQALSSIRAQNYEDMEVVLVDDGSTQASALAALDRLEPEFAGRGWQIVRQPNRYLGAARNTAARHARGDVLQFFDDDNVMKPEMVSTMARALICSGSDIVTSFCRQFEGNGAPGSPGARLGHEIRFVGAAESWSYLRNVVGDAACMIRREAFDAIGGFSEMQRTGKEDMELYHSAMVRRMKIEVVPEALYYYRRSSDSMKRRHTNFDAGVLRALRPHLARLPLPAAEAIRHLAAVYHRDQQRRAEDPVRSVGSWIRRRWPG